MKYAIRIEFEIESSEYHGIKPTKKDVTELVNAMIHDEADFPDEYDIVVNKVP